MLLVQGDDGAIGINRHYPFARRQIRHVGELKLIRANSPGVTRHRHVEPLRFAIRLHAFLTKWYATVTTAANRTTAAIQIQKTGVELSMSTPQAVDAVEW